MGDHSATKPIRMYSRWGVAMDMVAGDYSLITQLRLMYTCLHCTVYAFLPFSFFSRASKIGALFFFCSSFLSMVLSDASVTKVLSQCVDKKSSIQYSQDSVQPMADWMRFALHPQ
ncbi:hypothetical protein D6D08_00935 [Aureobasidium pullulans]|nr:hypothetical protein D6D08_00935 [Aureobasidium pullulans]